MTSTLRRAAALAATALLAPAAPALAGGHTLELSAPPAVVGRPLVVQATGSMPPEDVEFPYWFSLDAISTAVTTTCPPDRWEGVQFAKQGGATVVLSQRERPDESGRFTVPVAVTPTQAGKVLLCGYTDDGLTTTLASASLVLDIQPAATAGTPQSPAATPQRPTPASIAAQARSGARSCRALLDRPGSCVRQAVRKANAACRRLPARGARARCLKAVRRATRPGA